MSEPRRPRAVVFAYHDVGARCLRVLIAHGVDVPLVITHVDDPGENLWFERVSDVADSLRVPWIAPDDPNAPDVVARVAALEPDFLFSFYYRRMLGAPMLATARRGALNMHGSLLPKYRGRAPVNWAVLHGERETGATLHDMTAKPDAGGIVDQERVPIGPDETAREVFDKVTNAAARVLDRSLPAARRRHRDAPPERRRRGLVLRRPQARRRPHRLDLAREARARPRPRGRPTLPGRVLRAARREAGRASHAPRGRAVGRADGAGRVRRRRPDVRPRRRRRLRRDPRGRARRTAARRARDRLAPRVAGVTT